MTALDKLTSGSARDVVTVEVQGSGTFCGQSLVHIGDKTVVCRVNPPDPEEKAGPRYECSVCGQPERSCPHLKLAMSARRLLLGNLAAPVEDHQAGPPSRTRQPAVFIHGSAGENPPPSGRSEPRLVSDPPVGPSLPGFFPTPQPAPLGSERSEYARLAGGSRSCSPSGDCSWVAR